MNKKKVIWLIIVPVLLIAGIYAYQEYTRTNKDMLRVKPDHELLAIDLLNEYEAAEDIATKRYNGKVLEVTGFIKTVEKDENGYYTVVLGDSASLSSVRCSMDTVHQQDAAGLKSGTSTIIRGACTGFNKDELGLGSDVILNRCVIVEKKS